MKKTSLILLIALTLLLFTVLSTAFASNIAAMPPAPTIAQEGYHNLLAKSDDSLGIQGINATPTTSAVLVNGKTVAFDSYNIAGNNYFKLRDLAFTLNSTVKQFKVDWDSAQNSINLTNSLPYSAVGGEMQGKGAGEKVATPTSSIVYLDGREIQLTAYNIGGNNYFKLRDIGQAIDFGVGWDDATRIITIDTSTSYTENDMPIDVSPVADLESENNPSVTTENEPAIFADPIIATITMKNGGVIKLELYPDIAPQSVYNFAYLARQGFYDGLIFHRVIEGFVIQGGDPDGNGAGGPGYAIKGEFKLNGFDNPLKHERGIISMARSQRPDSAGSQFFIVHKDSTFLDGQYAAFGKVISGMDVVDEIAQTPTRGADRPVEDIIIKTITIEGPKLPEPERL